jgi:UDP-N-acetylmuramoyl-L-alanyl-D-glutamate--2,6-diaminopimelate ligase
MQLDELTAVLAPGARRPPDADGSIEISSLAYDSRVVQPGALFFCVPGFSSDGHDFAPQALARGAAALVVERALKSGAPEIVVADARAAMSAAAAVFFGYPSRALRVIGVTGTNGKTTTAFLVRALLEASGERCGLLGTVKSIVAGHDRAVERTTPEAIDVQSDLAEMLAGGDRACAMEVSSHALALERTTGIEFSAAIFTNLSRDHLDFHHSMEDYFLAKRRLFVPDTGDPPPRVSVVNIGDSYGARLAQELGGAVTVAVDAPAEYSASELRVGFGGVAFRLATPAGEREVSSPLRGRFNVANALGALAAVHALGCDLDVLVAALERGVSVPGRFEAVDEGQEFAALVDYAHTPDSLENVLHAARELAGADGRARVVCVFGAGGDRDRGKRAVMGEVASRLADVVIVTSDNPRSEVPEEIIDEIMAGALGAREHGGGAVRAITDRRAAIEHALGLARAGDVVVIAGKGHEQGQEFGGGRKVPFDDVSVVRDALRARRRDGAAGRPAGAAA